MRRIVFLLAILLASSVRAATTVTLLHFSDYHSHALPFYSEDRPNQGGIARAIGYMKEAKKNGALVFSGGDMVNKGAPAWSDKYRCAEWSWLSGTVDAMAFGNHDPDYGFDDFAKCRDSLKYPILSANTTGFKPYAVFVRDGIRIGVFAIAGSDFPSLVKTGGFTFTDSVAAARATVQTLHEQEHVDAVVLIGHEHLADDFALARAVPGIDLIFGTHSHLKRDFQQIPETSTYYIAPFQYLTYISRAELTFDQHKLTKVTGRLVRVDSALPSDTTVASRVKTMQRELEKDPQYAPLFRPIGTLASPMTLDALGDFAMDAAREAAHADVALSTASSFRQPLPPGVITGEILRQALPYDNEIVVASMNGETLAKLLAFARSGSSSDATAYVAGAPATIDPAHTYRVATTEYLAKVSGGYRDFFKGLDVQSTGLHVRSEVEKRLAGSAAH